VKKIRSLFLEASNVPKALLENVRGVLTQSGIRKQKKTRKTLTTSHTPWSFCLGFLLDVVEMPQHTQLVSILV